MIGIAITAILCTILGYGVCAMMVIAKDSDKLVAERILNLTDKKDYGLCSPPMKAQVAVNELCRYFLGEDWYTTLPESTEQVNTEIVYEIEKRYRGYLI